jgi:uncharacterized membrane protein
MTALGSGGGALAVVRATETDVLSLPSVSWLGIDAGASAFLNGTLLALGLALLALGLSLQPAFAALRSARGLSKPAELLLVAGFAVAGFAVIVAGLFPIEDQATTAVHNAAAFAAPIALVSTILCARLAIADLGHRFDFISAAILAGVSGSFAAALGGHLLPYAVMELICFGLIGGWLWLFEARLRRLLTKVN